MNARLLVIVLAFVAIGALLVALWPATSPEVKPVKIVEEPMVKVEGPSSFEASTTEQRVNATVPRVLEPADDDSANAPAAYVTDDELSRLREEEGREFFQRLKAENLSTLDLRYADARLSALLADAASRQQFREWLLLEPFDDSLIAREMMRLVARVDFRLFQLITLDAELESAGNVYAAALWAWPADQAKAAPDLAFRAAAPALETNNAYTQDHALQLLLRTDADLSPSLLEAVRAVHEGPLQDTAVYGLSGEILRSEGDRHRDDVRANAAELFENARDSAEQYMALAQLLVPPESREDDTDDATSRLASHAEYAATILPILGAALDEQDIMIQMAAFIRYRSVREVIDYLEVYLENPEWVERMAEEH